MQKMGALKAWKRERKYRELQMYYFNSAGVYSSSVVFWSLTHDFWMLGADNTNFIHILCVTLCLCKQSSEESPPWKMGEIWEDEHSITLFLWYCRAAANSSQAFTVFPKVCAKHISNWWSTEKMHFSLRLFFVIMQSRNFYSESSCLFAFYRQVLFPL